MSRKEGLCRALRAKIDVVTGYLLDINVHSFHRLGDTLISRESSIFFIFDPRRLASPLMTADLRQLSYGDLQ